MIVLNIVPAKDNVHKYTATVLDETGKLKEVKFGSVNHEHYYDLLKTYKKLNHNDADRRSNYYKRHAIDYPKFSADWFSKKILWPGKIVDKSKDEIIVLLNSMHR